MVGSYQIVHELIRYIGLYYRMYNHHHDRHLGGGGTNSKYAPILGKSLHALPT